MKRLVVIFCLSACASGPQPAVSPKPRKENESAVAAYRDAIHLAKLGGENRRRAITQLKEVLAQDGSLWEAWYDLGRLYLDEHKPQDAKDAFGKALKGAPPFPPLLVAFADAALQMRRPQDAVGPLSDASAKLTGDEAVLVHIKLGEVERALDHNDKAMAQVRKGLRFAPRNVSALNLLAQLYVDRKEFSLAELVLRKALQIEGTGKGAAPTLNNLGLVALAERRDQEAFASFDLASRADPTLLDARLNKATVYLDCGDFKKALDEIDSLLKSDAKTPRVWLLRGVAQHGLGQAEPALSAYRKALDLDPNFSDAMFNAAGLLIDPLKRPREAQALLERFLEVTGGNHERAKEAKERLAEIEKSAGGKR